MFCLSTATALMAQSQTENYVRGLQKWELPQCLMEAAQVTGAQPHMCECIESSPASELLLPMGTSFQHWLPDSQPPLWKCPLPRFPQIQMRPSLQGPLLQTYPSLSMYTRCSWDQTLRVTLYLTNWCPKIFTLNRKSLKTRY